MNRPVGSPEGGGAGPAGGDREKAVTHTLLLQMLNQGQILLAKFQFCFSIEVCIPSETLIQLTFDL